MERGVLIVEDEVLVGMMLARKLEEYGYHVTAVVGTGEEALDLLEASCPGVVLMDVSLGGELDGIATAEMIRRRYGLPVVFFTGYSGDEALAARAGEVGALAVLDKLGPIEKLVEVLNRGLSGNI